MLSVSSDAATAVPRYAPADSADAPTARVREPDLAVTPAPRGSLLELADRFEGFEVLGELGRGAMGRVYLARQHAPTERLVVLKVGTHLSAECRKLSKLQHPHIVPVYSFHQNGRSQAVCMPYRGPLTLSHAVARLRAGNVHTLDGRALTTALDECRKSRVESVAATAPVPLPEAAPAARRTFAPLGKLNYTDAVLTLFAQIADGLRAAHAEHIVHCDLKPANVLIADDGTAQLIDFGVALDTSDAVDRMRLGGTRPYMSPEQLESFASGSVEHDERSDLYAVGVMLYEVLTGELPFEALYDSSADCLARDRANRYAPFVPVREWNPNVPPAVCAIIDKCLAPRVAERYQSAAHLHDDLTRQLARKPLAHAPNPSTGELVRKWGARNRALLVAGAVLALAGSAVAGFAHRDAVRTEREAVAAVRAEAEPFAADRDEAEFHFIMTRTDPAARARAWGAARRALDRYSAWDANAWADAPAVRALETDERAAARRRVAGLLLILAHDRAQEAARTADPAGRAAKLADASAWAERAASAHPDATNWRALLAHKARAARAAGDPAEAERLERRAAALPRTAADGALEACELLLDNRPRAALAVLAESTRTEPGHFWCAFYAAVAHQLLERHPEAERGFDACLLLRPGFAHAHYNRGLSRFYAGRAAEAEADFDRALAANPGWAHALYARSLAREHRGTPESLTGALADLSAARAAGHTPVPLLLVRAGLNAKRGDAGAADADRAAALATEPTDARGWTARGTALIHTDPKAALAAYERALALDPRSAAALQGKALVLGESGKNREALDAVNALLEVTPDSADAWCGRAVLKARAGDRAGALADADEALKLAVRADTLYALAGAYGRFAVTDPEARRTALRVLDDALRAGVGFEHLNTDPDLAELRKVPEFEPLVTAARAHRERLRRLAD